MIIILLDDIGADHIGAYGLDPEAPATPNIDALAAEGVRFDRAWSNPACSPTRASLLTGKWAFRTGIGEPISADEPWGLPLDFVTLPELLSDAPDSWDTAAIGKWHLGTEAVGGDDHPNLSGFAHFAGTIANFNRPAIDGGKQNYFRWNRTVDGETTLSGDYVTSVTTEDAIVRMTAMEPPWLLYVAYNAAHTPMHIPPASLHDRELTAGSSSWDKFDAMVEAVDQEIGRLLAAVPDPESTTVILMGDNGTATQAYPSWHVLHWASKFSLFEPGVRVPLVVRGPSVVDPGRAEAALVHAVDVFATVAEIAGVPTDVDGVSFGPLLSRQASTVRSFLYAEKFGPAGPGPWHYWDRAVRDDRWKLVRLGDGVERLYDLEGVEVEGESLLADDATLSGEAAEAHTRLTALLEGLTP